MLNKGFYESLMELSSAPRKISTSSILKTPRTYTWGKKERLINEGMIHESEHPSRIIGHSTMPPPKKSNSLLKIRNLVPSVSQNYLGSLP